VIGHSDGNADQAFSLTATSVERDSLQLQVEEPGRGYQPWIRVDDLALAGRDDRVYALDSEAGAIRFGDAVNGRIPNVGSRVRVALMRAGGGATGNLPAGSLTGIDARDLDGNRVNKLKINQPLPTGGGDDAETLAEAERRIPALFRHRDRAVTGDDFRRLAADTPGVAVGRVEVMSRFKPHQRRFNVPGVVSVMVLPQKEAVMPPNPRPDRPFLESIHNYLDERRPVGTEMYTIGCEYIPLGVSVSVRISNGFGQEQVLRDVRQALRQYLWPLLPGGPQQEGWPLGRAVRERELEVVVARVPGVNSVNGINLFKRSGNNWQLIPRVGSSAVELAMSAWQLPELLSVVAVADDVASATAPANLDGVPNPFAAEDEIAVPVVPEVCY
jgi:predicted phage baseplate assembly protein